MRILTIAALALLVGCSSSTSTGTGGGGGTGGANVGGSGVGGTGAAPSCQSYCASVTAACTGDDAVYSSATNCEQVCALLPEGELTSVMGNSVGCRQHLAADAADDSSLCPAVGPGGEGVCGSNCEAFCLLFQGLCGTRFDEAYADLADCRASCASDIPDVGGFSAGTTISGDSVQCRLYHVSQAADDSAQHCGHAAGDAICVP